MPEVSGPAPLNTERGKRLVREKGSLCFPSLRRGAPVGTRVGFDLGVLQFFPF